MGGFLAVAGDGITDMRALEALTSALAYRGAPTVFVDHVVLVAFERPGRPGLAVADDLAVAADVRLHNREQLDELLGTAGATDADVLLAAWRAWGVEALDRVLGDFAAAIWDRAAKRLTIVRDAMGARPALLARAGGRLLAGSAIAGLLADPAFDAAIDDSWVAAYLGAISDDQTATGYRDMARLQPGTIAHASREGWRTERWFRHRARRVRERGDDAYARRFRALFDEAVRCRIEPARRLGVMLSGGLDSTSVAAVARQLRPELPMVAIAMPFEDPRGDERSIQRAVAERIGAGLRWVPLADAKPLGMNGPASTFATIGVPSMPPNRFHAELMADAGADEGVDVVLDGIDGDGVVGGNFYYLSDLFVSGRWRAWRREARAARRLHRVGARALLGEYTIAPLLPAALRLAIRRRRGREVVPGFVDPAFARAHRLARRIEGDGWAPGRSFALVERMAVSSPITPVVLEIMNEEWERRGIEVAHPFLDRRLVSFCLGLPRRQKVAMGVTKLVLRRAVGGLLPSEVAERSDKAELSRAFLDGFSGSGRPDVTEGLALASSNPSPWFHLDGVRALEGGPVERSAFPAFRVAGLALWRAWLQERRWEGAGDPLGVSSARNGRGSR